MHPTYERLLMTLERERPIGDQPEDLARIVRAMKLADQAGSPIARHNDELADKALRRLQSMHRRLGEGPTPHREAMVEDLTHGFVDWFGGKDEVGPLIADCRWLAGVICDHVFFIPPAGSSGWTVDAHDTTVVTEIRTRLHDAARAVGLAVTRQEYTGPYNRSFESYRIEGWGPLWALFHRAVPIFAFTDQPPGGYPLEPAGDIIDPPFDVGSLISGGWRFLNADQAACQLSPGRIVDLLERDITGLPGTPKVVHHTLFSTSS